MVLLDALHRTGPRNLQIGVAHFNHHLRGKESDADEALVRRVCARRRIRCFLGHGYFADRAGARRESMEMAARSLRYAFLREVAGSEGFRCVVTAHHAEDQLELFLLRLARGAGGDGLAGMSFVDSLPGDPNILLLRPLLQVDRSAIREWASTHRVLFREDRSNRSTEILRNRIRIRVLPMLRRELGEEVATGIGRSIDIVTAESDCIRQLASGWLSRMSPRAAFNKLPIAVQRQVLRLQLLDFGMDPGFNGVETLRRAPESVVTEWCAQPVVGSVGQSRQ